MMLPDALVLSCLVLSLAACAASSSPPGSDMGDKKYDNPSLLAAELLRHCMEPPNLELRTEVFCQLIKQVTANPSTESAQRGWELIVLCLSTFPPSSDFENYLEMYLRSCGNPPSKYVNLMHGQCAR